MHRIEIVSFSCCFSGMISDLFGIILLIFTTLATAPVVLTPVKASYTKTKLSMHLAYLNFNWALMYFCSSVLLLFKIKLI